MPARKLLPFALALLLALPVAAANYLLGVPPNYSAVDIVSGPSGVVVSSDGVTITITWPVAMTRGAGWSGSNINVDGTNAGDNIAWAYSSGDGSVTWVGTISGALCLQGATIDLDFDGGANSVEYGAGTDAAAFSNLPAVNNSTQTGGVTYLFTESFEGTGYENSWTEDFGTPNEDDTSPVSHGSQSLNTASGHRITCNTTWTAPATASSRIAIYTTSITTSDDVIRGMNGSTVVWSIQKRSDSSIRFYHGTASWTSATSYGTGAWAYVWVDYTASSGSNDGTLAIYLSTTKTKPGSPTQTITTGTSTLGHSGWYIRRDEVADFNIDDIAVDDVPVGDFQ